MKKESIHEKIMKYGFEILVVSMVLTAGTAIFLEIIK